MQNSIFHQPGGAYKNFAVTRRIPLEELQSVLLELNHVPSGARVIHIENDDPENLFCLSFRTYPNSSNGVAHVLEHTVLCGSQKFPVKDPFFSMNRRSLNTFMNALTGQDFTCYPASSQVEKDFYNLLEVYLDAVFYPLLDKFSFLQEGHRLEFADPSHRDGALQFQGVVFNEMKGSLASVDARLWHEVYQRLLPDLPYAHNTGGDPKEIPNLTYEELKEFHRTFYHPSRCLFFFYGNLPLEKHLDCIENNVLANAAKTAPLPPLARQERFPLPITGTAKYPIAAQESVEKKTIFAFGWLTAPVIQQREILALSLLDIILMDHDASLLRRVLLRSGLCAQTSASLDTEMSEAPWLIVCKGCSSADQEKLKDLIFNTIKEISRKPIPEEFVQSALHQLEFNRMEINTDEGPFGLTLFMRAALIAQHGSNPENGLLIHTLFNELRENLKDPSYLPFLIEHFFLNNPHFLQLTFEPDPLLEAQELAEEKKRLEDLHAAMTPEEIQALVKQSQELSAYQEKAENQSLDCLPKLSLSDISVSIRPLPLKETPLHPNNLKSGYLDCSKAPELTSVDCTSSNRESFRAGLNADVSDCLGGETGTVFHHSCFTNHILYADAVFDLPHIAVEDLPLLSLFSRWITELGCGGKDYRETLRRSQAFTGGVSASCSLHVSAHDPDRCSPSFSIHGKSLGRHAGELFSLFRDLLSSPDFSDTARIQELLTQHAAQLQSRLTRNAMTYAIQASLAGFSLPSFVFEQCHGLSYYTAVLERLKNPQTLGEDLTRLQEEMLGRGAMHLVLSCDDAQYALLEEHQFYDLGSLPRRPLASPWKGGYALPKIPSQARLIASPVAFNALGMKTVSYKENESPFLFLAAVLLENVALHKEMREKGGAYGAGASYTPTTGNFYFNTYRDPHVAKTLAGFQKSLETLAAKKFSAEDLEEAKFGALQTLDAPVAPGSRAMTAYAWKRAHRTDAMREEFRRKILFATREEIADAVEKCLLDRESVFVSYLGEALFEKEKKKISMHLPALPLP